jgi:alanine racemase
VNRGPVAEINLSALNHNLKIIKQIARNRTVIAVVKADAYGHGAVEISKKLVAEGVSYLAVAYTGEAKILRNAGIDAKIIVLFDRTDISDYFQYDLTPVLHDKNTALEFSEEASKKGRPVTVHLKIDTGMGRMGLNPDKAVTDALEISCMGGLRIEGLMSHFSEADLADKSYALRQLEIFSGIQKIISEKLGYSLMTHMANSAAVLSFGEALLEAVRPGLMLYGYSPFSEQYGLQPLMKVKTNILMLRDLPSEYPVSYGRTFITKRQSTIAVVPVGYADGYNRLFSNNAFVLIRGKRAPVVGRVCMDITMADVTDIDNVSEGDEVVLLGRQGNEMITATELSARINTIPYDIITSLGSRARKEYLH